MLQKLKIKNIALIDECIIDFQKGLNTLTGETGAGKSIIIDALNFSLGARSDRNLIKSGTEFAKVEAYFFTEDDEVLQILDDVGIEKDSTIIVSRTMHLNSKNECRVNGEIVPLSIVKKITSKLVDVFGQNDQQFLLDVDQHLYFLDIYKEEMLSKDKEALQILLNELSEIKKNIKLIGGDGEERNRNIDILKYQINEIGEADVSPEAIDSSALEDLVTKYVPGRSSVTDSIPFTVNATNDTIAEWTEILGKTVCILVDVPGLDKQWFVIVTVPNILPMPSMGQNNLLTMVVNCTVNDFIGLSERVAVDTSAVVQDEE